MTKGEIFFVEMPVSAGHEQHGLRPALILSQPEGGTCLIVPFTSNLQALKFTHTLAINPSKRNGLKTVSVALVFQMRAIDKRRIRNKIGNVDSSSLSKINSLIKSILTV